MSHIVVTGNPISGFIYYGVFPSQEDAITFAEAKVEDGDWWIAPINLESSTRIEPIALEPQAWEKLAPAIDPRGLKEYWDSKYSTTNFVDNKDIKFIDWDTRMVSYDPRNEIAPVPVSSQLRSSEGPTPPRLTTERLYEELREVKQWVELPTVGVDFQRSYELHRRNKQKE